jgi:hypothetical protein
MDNIALVQHQQLSSTALIVLAQLELMVHNVFHAQHQDSGIITLVNAFAQKRESGMVKTVFVNQDFTELIVSAAHLKNIGMKQLKHVFAQLHSFGTVNIVYAQQDMI